MHLAMTPTTVASEDDEGIGLLSPAPSTAALDVDLTPVEENGRTYHGWLRGKYPLPNDEREQDRLDWQHKVWYLTLGKRLCLAPVDQLHGHAGGAVLDIGAGTGIWAIDFADKYPAAKVVGVDIDEMQPEVVPPNLSFELDDLEQDWSFTQKFSYIHGRTILTYLADPARAVQQAFDALGPDGFLEIQEAPPWLKCDDKSLEGTATAKWQNLLREAVQQSGTPWTALEEYKGYMEAAGFINIREVEYRWPIRALRDELHTRKERILGLCSVLSFSDGLEPWSMAPMTRHLGMTQKEVRDILAGVQKEVSQYKINAYFPVLVIYGQKPGRQS